MTNKTLDQLTALPLPPLTSDLLPILRPSVGILESITWGNVVSLLPLGGQIYGLTLSAAGSSAIFGIAAGQASNSTNAVLMSLASAYTKTTGAWVAGSGNGALDTGVIANNTWYHVHLIQRSDTGLVDVLASTSATAPTLPTNYTSFRRIGSMKTDGSANWTKFVQLGDKFEWDVPVLDGNSLPTTTSATLTTLTVPPGINVGSIVTYGLAASGGGQVVLVTSPLVTDRVPNVISGDSTIYCASAIILNAPRLEIVTDTSQRIRWRSNTASANLYILTNGWTDPRGRNG